MIKCNVFSERDGSLFLVNSFETCSMQFEKKRIITFYSEKESKEGKIRLPFCSLLIEEISLIEFESL